MGGNCEPLSQHRSSGACGGSPLDHAGHGCTAGAGVHCPSRVTLTACGFEVHATRSGKVKRIGLTTVFPNERVTLTNPETDISVTYDIAGALSVRPTDVGVTLRFTGHNLVLGPGIGILYITGNQTFVEDVDGLRLAASQGKVLSVCGVLAP